MNIGIKNLYDDSILVAVTENSDIVLGDKLIFQHEKREFVGQVVFVDRQKLDAEEIILNGKIVRKINEKDLEKLKESEKICADAFKKIQEKIEKLSLPMQIVETRITFDEEEINFFYITPDRIDFKEIVPKFAGILKKRVHLTQLGMRDRAKAAGGFGICGRQQCCTSGALPKFKSVTMSTVKGQELTMKGSDKLSGPCGKLLCCLNYEIAEYKQLRKKMPAWGSQVMTKKGEGKIIALDILNQKVKVLIEKGGVQFFDVAEIKKLKK